MGTRMKNIAGLFSNLRTRNIIILTGIILLLVVIVGIVGLRRGTSESDSKASFGKMPSVKATGELAEVSPEIQSMVESLDEQRYEEAKKSRKSALPTFLGSGKMSVNEQDANALKKGEQDAGVANANAANLAPEYAGLTPEQIAILRANGVDPTKAQIPVKSSAQSMDAQRLAQNAKEMDQVKQQVIQNMQRQTKALMLSWTGETGTPKQYYQEVEIKEEKITSAKQSSTTILTDKEKLELANANANEPAAIKAGDIVFAVLNTAINSDEPGPILATVVTGPYRGAKLIGGLQQTRDIPGTNGPTAVTLTFNNMNVPALPRTISINAVAIDPDTARTAIASDVDHHYFLRYGTLFASSFLEGYGSAITDAGEVIINNPAGGSTEFKQKLTGKQEFLAALGNVGQQWGEQMGDTFNRPNTIYVNSGLSLGILFLTDVTIKE